MSKSLRMRQFHRWLSISFAMIVFAIFVAMGAGAAMPNWAYYLPLPPLALLMLTGLYLFALPYLSKPHRPKQPVPATEQQP